VNKIPNSPLYICSIDIEDEIYYGVGVMDHTCEIMKITIPIEYLPKKIWVEHIPPKNPGELPHELSELYIITSLDGDGYEIIRRLSEEELKQLSPFSWLQSYYGTTPCFIGGWTDVD
jgi:hypothetical protein